MVYKRIQKKAETNGYRVYDYFIDNMHTENKYYLINENNVILGFDRLTDLDAAIDEAIINRSEKLKKLEQLNKEQMKEECKNEHTI